MSTETEQPSPRPPSRRRLLRYSLRTLLLLTVAAAVGSWGLKLHYAQQRELREIVPIAWDVETGQNVKWRIPFGHYWGKNVCPIASRGAHLTPCIAGGKVFIGASNGFRGADLGLLLCHDAESGEFLWQHSNQRLPGGTRSDWPQMGIASTPHVEGDRLWYVNNRCEVVCLDTEGFRDNVNDGPFRSEDVQAPDEADVIWKFDMIGRLGVYPFQMTACSIAAWGDLLFVNTCNGVDPTEEHVPAPDAPNFLALDKRDGRVVWTDNSVGKNVLRGGWASPTCAVLGGVPQVLFPGGDGWLYSFDPEGDGAGNSKLLWKFDCNPKTSRWQWGGRRNYFIAAPVTCDGLVYIATGQEFSRGEGDGDLWCIDPTRRGDVSPELVFNRKAADPTKPIPHKRVQACVPAEGDFVRPNPHSAAVWHYQSFDHNGDGKIQFEEEFQRTMGQPAIKNGLLVILDGHGLVHCLDARTGQRHWTYDARSYGMSSVLIAGQHIYVDEQGPDSDVAVLQLSADPKVALPGGAPLHQMKLGNYIYGNPVADNNVLYISTMGQLFAIAEGANDKQPRGQPANK